ncbi:MJ0936 family phosphodiesterase [Enterococcus haemoperoxidus ATCC BAA-382]|uniref:Phosphoesterase n=1 Tax=Enterococcus haemoperoxidus ATCC BAA-382 TaxID=1158608 RepID=R2QPQ4_9ENTE|nr:metallophosphoesterase [Enterococcus haemoperoxidus]EOH98467.1 MJ0936 family phosphodiesterase [Enterococcus haemoperoxidus ATCC BAA-382]EOT62350.1 phosphoesterase [Enterococcus haemoperoxidus ATCC BAA-382]OJG55568.1 MJ0936 family phosphodiesterase [Enterococcus haemoperoxidus]
MKYLIVSDNHGDRDVLVDLAGTYRGKVDKMFHCGDSELEPTDVLWNDFSVVKGNCDYDPEFPDTIVEKNGTDTIFMTHGHLANVRSGLTTLALQANQVNANIVLFGHTHEIGCEVRANVLYLNPGSISLPRGPIQLKSYAIIESTPDQFSVQYYGRNHQPFKELHFVFNKK